MSNNIITDKTKLLQKWRERARTNQIINYDEEERLKRIHRWLGLPAIVLSALVASMMLLLIKLIGEDWVKIVFGILGFIASSLTFLQTTGKYLEQAESHKNAAVEYGCIFRQIERILASSTLLQEKELVKIETKLNEAARMAPTIPRRKWKKARTVVTEHEKILIETGGELLKTPEP